MGLGKDLKQLIADTPTILSLEDAIEDMPAIVEVKDEIVALSADATALAALADDQTTLTSLAEDDTGILAASSAIAAGVATESVTVVTQVQYITDPSAGIQVKTKAITITDGVITAVGVESEWT